LELQPVFTGSRVRIRIRVLAFRVGGPLGGGFLADAAADGDVAERAAFGPVALAVLAEMAGLGEVVVVEVAELGVGRIATWAYQPLLLWEQ